MFKFLKSIFFLSIPVLIILLLFSATTGKVFNFGLFFDEFFKSVNNIDYLTQDCLNSLSESWYFITHFDINAFTDMIGFFNNIGDLISNAFKLAISVAGLVVCPVIDLVNIIFTGLLGVNFSNCWVEPVQFGDILL